MTPHTLHAEHIIAAARAKKSEPSPVPVEPVDWIVEEPAEFGRCIRQGGRPEVGGEEGTANVAVLEAIIESNRTGRAVQVAWE